MTEPYGPPDPFSRLRNVTIEDVMLATGLVHNLPTHELVGPKRKRMFARPRQMAMFVASRRTGRSLPEIGRAFGGRDHSTVSWARDQIARLIASDYEMAFSVKMVERLADAIAAERFAEMRPRLAAYR